MANEVLVVILNYRTADLAVACLESLAAEARDVDGLRAVVVDGGSADGSAERLTRAISERYASFAGLLALERNGGFAYGNNAAIQRALRESNPPQFFYLLNPDTLVRPGALRELLRFAHAHPAAGILGSRCENPDGSARCSAFRFHSALGELEAEANFGPISRLLREHAVALPAADAPVRSDWVSGAAMLVRRDVFERIGLLDEGYFLYFEETDFARRAAARGFECWYVPSSRVLHYCGQATSITGERAASTRVPQYWYASRRRYFEKHHGRLYAAVADTAWLTGVSLRRARSALGRSVGRGTRAAEPPHRYRDFVRYNLRRWVQP